MLEWLIKTFSNFCSQGFCFIHTEKDIELLVARGRGFANQIFTQLCWSLTR